jgi:hypothetical protein
MSFKASVVIMLNWSREAIKAEIVHLLAICLFAATNAPQPKNAEQRSPFIFLEPLLHDMAS